MLENLKSYLQYGTTYAAIECISDEESYSYFGVTAKKKNSEFEEINQYTSSSVTDIAKRFSNNQHCQLIVNTDQVLIKETQLQDSNSVMIAEAFPGLSQQDFYINLYKTSVNCFIALCRKEAITPILKEFEKNKLEVVGIQLGFGTIEKLLPFFTVENLYTNKHSLHLLANEVADYDINFTKTDSYSIADLSIPSSQIMALSGLFTYVNETNCVVGELESTNKFLTSQQAEKTFFRKGKIIGIGILAIMLIVNTFLFTRYYSKYQNLQTSTYNADGLKDTFIKTTERVEQKEKMVASIGKGGNSKSSFYINRLVNNQPSSIQLSSIIYHPLLKSIQPKKEIALDTNKMIVEGTSMDKIAFNLWLESLENTHWITDITVFEYSQVNSNKADFGITINLKNNDPKN